MGEEPLAETRLAISAQRRELERTADQLRDALDLKKRFRENPAVFVGLGAGALFLLAGGPVRAARLVRRRLFRSEPEKAYDALPKPMQSWVDTMAGTLGPRAAEARQSLSEELVRWRHDPKRNGKTSRKLAKVTWFGVILASAHQRVTTRAGAGQTYLVTRSVIPL